MPIQFQCHGCGRLFHVHDRMAGTRAACQQCGTILTVPLPAGSLQPIGAVPQTPQQKPVKGRQTAPEDASGGIPPMVWYLIGGGAMFVFFAIGVAVIFNAVFSSSSSDAQTAPATASARAWTLISRERWSNVH